MNPLKDIHFHRRNLPHFYRPGATYFVTYGLKNSLSASLMKGLHRKAVLKTALRTKSLREDFDRKWFDEYDTLLAKNNDSGLRLDKKLMAEAVVSPINYLNEKEIKLLA